MERIAHMFLSLSSEQFNLYEGCFWIVVGVIPWVLYLYFGKKFQIFAIFTSGALVLFGISDFMQVLYGSFFQRELTWLLVWKVLNTMALVSSIVWYFVLRLK